MDVKILMKPFTDSLLDLTLKSLDGEMPSSSYEQEHDLKILEMVNELYANYIISPDEIRAAKIYAGQMAGICYMKENIDQILHEDPEKSIKRAERTLKSGHHSVWGHIKYTFYFEGIPKILAMILNNEQDQDTSEKSARYTQMKLEGDELNTYNWWLQAFSGRISKLYPDMEENRVVKLAQENARYFISVFTPSTNMAYTVDLRQINYILGWMQKLVNETIARNGKEIDAMSMDWAQLRFKRMLVPVLQEFIEMMKPLVYIEGLQDNKNRGLSLFGTRNKQEHFGETYCTTYYGSFAQLAQAQRHRFLDYEMRLDILELANFYLPDCLRDTKLNSEFDLRAAYCKDMGRLRKKYPQGMQVIICESGASIEKFIRKCKERLCGAAQLEVCRQTQLNFFQYVNHLKNDPKADPKLLEYLESYGNGEFPRCKFPDFQCTAPCIWGPEGAFTRRV